jgi:hypothetical protein
MYRLDIPHLSKSAVVALHMVCYFWARLREKCQKFEIMLVQNQRWRDIH